jgi:Zn-dependent peptidase ImmA (M78 family)
MLCLPPETGIACVLKEVAMTQVQLPTRMADLYQRLISVGLSKSFVQKQGLPDWWCEEYEQTDGAIVTAAAHISKRLNLDLPSLLNEQMQPRFVLTSQPKYKIQNGTNLQQLPISSAIAAKVAEIVASACKTPYQPIESLSVAAIREEILSSRQFVDLEGFLVFCWSRGIPVVHFDQFPKSSGIKKFQGMAACFHQRPVIVLSLNASSPSRLLFIAAHELGHILHGHLNLMNEGLLVDEAVELESKDEEEIEANEVAAELLLGRPDRVYYTPRSYTAPQLVEYAQQVGAKDGVSPGVVALNYGWWKKHWGATNAALKLLEPHADAPRQINRYLSEHLDWDHLGHDYQEYLELVLDLERG